MNCGRTVSEPVDGWRGVGAVMQADEKLRVVGVLVV